MSNSYSLRRESRSARGVKRSFSSSPTSTASTASQGNTPKLPSFVSKLVEILDHSPQELISWAPCGDGFIIYDVKRFAREVLGKYFKSANFSSFVRQANFYAFSKVSGSSRTPWHFKHEKFIRGRFDLMSQIKRKTSQEYHNQAMEEVEHLTSVVEQLRAQVASLQSQLHAANVTIQHYQHAAGSSSSATQISTYSQDLASLPQSSSTYGTTTVTPLTSLAASVPMSQTFPQPAAILNPDDYDIMQTSSKKCRVADTPLITVSGLTSSDSGFSDSYTSSTMSNGTFEEDLSFFESFHDFNPIDSETRLLDQFTV